MELVVDDASVKAASSIVVANGCKPARIVLREVGGVQPYVTHLETLTLVTRAGECVFEHDGFTQGHYFTDWKEAEKDFWERANMFRLTRS